ncbi:Calcium-transporting_ATPase [Hexamita inflata]|uniref:Calcium-transporting ATPase n=1 Tax=Hexamita inflata TaxID=28002 RepID=A0AA86QM13_9EUKA|nr:Calcium-transporting ATPase [Hexamita inflata]
MQESLLITEKQQDDNIYSSLVKDRLPINAHELAVELGSTIANGLNLKQVETNQARYGVNRIPERPPKKFWKIYLGTFSDPTLIILLISSLVSIIIGVAVAEERKHGGYIDGIAIIVAVIVVSMVASINDFQNEKQFRKLNAVKEARNVQVVRGGQQQSISIYDLVVGDILVVNQGDQVLVDGLITTTQLIKFDESSMTGETQMMLKTAQKPWIISGSLVQEGSGRMLVTAVGKSSIHGEMMMALGEENNEDTPLQQKLNQIVKYIGYVGSVSAAFTFIVLIIKFFAAGKQSNKENYTEWISFLILAIAIIVMAIPEGLPLAVTIALAYSMKKMLKDQCLVRKLNSCETCGSVSVICSDKTGTLTKNEMHVTHMWSPAAVEDLVSAMVSDKKSKPLSYFDRVMCLNTSFTNNCRLEGNKVVGAKTTGAFLMLSRDLYGCNYEEVRAGLTIEDDVDKAIVHQLDFSSDRKRASILVDLDVYRPSKLVEEAAAALRQQGQFVNMIRGASEIMLSRCVQYLDPRTNQVCELDEAIRAAILKQIGTYASQSMRTLICAYKTLQQKTEAVEQLEEEMESQLVFLSLVGIKDPLREGVPEAIEVLKSAGVRTIMVTGDNFDTAVAISKDANIISRDVSQADVHKFAIEGKELRQLSDEQLDERLSTLCCVARCQPTDKYRVVKRLKHLGNVVAATGDGSNDAPQLKEADVGLAMGIAGTEIAKEASDIIILDDNFCSIVQAVRWGRSVLTSIRKFIQFQLTVNVVACLITFIGSAVFGESPLTSIQLLYVNLIMDSLGSLALATEGPTKDILQHLPVKRNASIITPGMLRNVLGMAAYQLFVILLMLFEGFGDKVIMTPAGLPAEKKISYRYTSIYNFFILAQIVNEINSRRLHSELNVFEGLSQCGLFIIVELITLALQIAIMFVPGLRNVFKVFTCKITDDDCNGIVLYGITWQTWMIDMVLALSTLLVHLIVRQYKCKEEFEVRKR